MEAVRKIDEKQSASAEAPAADSPTPAARKVLVIDDSAMLLNFVDEILTEANYQVSTAATAEEGLRAAATETPHLILLAYVLPDMQGDEVLRRLAENPGTAGSRVVYMSGFGADLKSDPDQSPNVIGSLHKPFTSELLLKTVEIHMPSEPASSDTATAEPATQEQSSASPAENLETTAVGFAEAEPESASGVPTESEPTEDRETAAVEAAAGGSNDAWWSAAPALVPAESAAPVAPPAFQTAPDFEMAGMPDNSDEGARADTSTGADIPIPSGAAYFCGDTSFFSLNWALNTIAAQKLTGTLRCFWNREPVELLSRDGEILLATTHDPELYCTESPITLVSVEQDRIAAARTQQRETGCPFFMALAQTGQIIREPAVQLMQHYGQKLFAQLWTGTRVRFTFEQNDVPAYAQDFPGEQDADHWALGTLRFIQFQELGAQANFDLAFIPAYTRDGFDRVQKLRLTVAEAQFASQFNGSRSIAQIAKNLRLDVKFARLTLFRFLALEIVECWPPVITAKQEKRGVLGRIFGG